MTEFERKILDKSKEKDLVLDGSDIKAIREADMDEAETETTQNLKGLMLESHYAFSEETDLPAKVTVSEVKRRMSAEGR